MFRNSIEDPIMMKCAVTLAVFALSAAASVEAQQAPDLAPYLMPDRASEVALARTAAPTAVSHAATVLVLTKTGYVEASHGTNGFTCLVARSFVGRIGDPGFWVARVRAPICFNPPGARTIMPAMVKRTEWTMGGVAQTEVATRVHRAYASQEFPMPAAGAMAYMLSHKQHLAEVDPHWMPHLMFFYDTSLPASAWGAGDQTAPIIDGGNPDAPVLTLLIPVRQWSDGTPALPMAGAKMK
jgi:hypothetical protein